MFDFDEIEEEVQNAGADAWKEEKPVSKDVSTPAAEKDSSPAAGNATEEKKTEAEPSKKESDGGMFDFDEIEEDAMTRGTAQSAPAGDSIAVDVAFCYKSQKWSQSFRVPKGSTVQELKKQIVADGPSEASWIQLHKSGNPLADDTQLAEDVRLNFHLEPPDEVRSRRRRCFAPEPPTAPPGGWEGELEVTIYVDRVAGICQKMKVPKGSTVAALKASMAKQDPSGVTTPDDFELSVSGGSGRPLAAQTILADVGLSQLDLRPALKP
eukprot:TRINITY_DN82124_c0_g1_i1.p1 TRINITY_DN82124_c0_g1~~TRINITY_DN82124_c0_g1_i1.p1  ORF type:complete len:267 (-),score=70.54 TRINITY_DN82124_c0_g1_i1:56-856(-)